MEPRTAPGPQNEPASSVPSLSARVQPSFEKRGPKPDEFPRTPAQWAAFAALPADERSAVYLRSIRAMLVFFTVLILLGIIAGVALALAGIHAIDQSNATTTNPFG